MPSHLQPTKSTGQAVMTPKELSIELGISVTMVYRMLQSGEIPRRRAGKRYIIPRAAVTDWLRNTHAATEIEK